MRGVKLPVIRHVRQGRAVREGVFVQDEIIVKNDLFQFRAIAERAFADLDLDPKARELDLLQIDAPSESSRRDIGDRGRNDQFSNVFIVLEHAEEMLISRHVIHFSDILHQSGKDQHLARLDAPFTLVLLFSVVQIRHILFPPLLFPQDFFYCPCGAKYTPSERMKKLQSL